MQSSNYPYRPGIIAYIVDQENNFLLLQPKSYKDGEWAFLGGGKEGDETELENLYREIHEEIGLDEDDFVLIGKSNYPLKYDFPDDFFVENPDIKFRGQVKEQYFLKLISDKSKISIDPTEIRDILWVDINEIEEYLKFPAQYKQFKKIVKEFLQIEI